MIIWIIRNLDERFPRRSILVSVRALELALLAFWNQDIMITQYTTRMLKIPMKTRILEHIWTLSLLTHFCRKFCLRFNIVNICAIVSSHTKRSCSKQQAANCKREHTETIWDTENTSASDFMCESECTFHMWWSKIFSFSSLTVICSRFVKKLLKCSLWLIHLLNCGFSVWQHWKRRMKRMVRKVREGKGWKWRHIKRHTPTTW